MALTETEGLILKTYGLSDADKIVVFFTKSEGLIRGVAKGAKRLKSKFGGSLEPFSIVHLSYLKKEDGDLVLVHGIELTKSYFGYAKDPRFLMTFSYLVELLSNFAPPHDPDIRLYKMAKVCLDVGSQKLEYLNTITFYFEYWILRLGGYLPNWKVCGDCNRTLESHDASFMQLDFRLFCSQCAKSKGRTEIFPSKRELFGKAQESGPDKFIETTTGQMKELEDVSKIFKRIISRVLDRDVAKSKILSTDLTR